MAAAQASERRARYAEALLFWAITLVVCAGAGYGSYRYGRSWIGDRLGDDVKSVLTSEQLSSRVTSEAFERAPAGQSSDVEEEPPKEAVVDVNAATIGDGDRAKLEAEKSGRKAADADEDDASAEPEAKSAEPDDDAEEAQPERDEPARTEPAPRRASAHTQDSSGRYVVRAGSFRDRKNAERVVQELRAQGYSPYMTTIVKDNAEYTRVNVGSYEDKDEALKLRGELRGDGYSDASVATE